MRQELGQKESFGMLCSLNGPSWPTDTKLGLKFVHFGAVKFQFFTSSRP